MTGRTFHEREAAFCEFTSAPTPACFDRGALDEYGLILGASGDLDPSFNNGGRIIVSVGPTGGTANALVQQSDGRIVVAGYGSGNADFILARLTTAGALDASFGSAGIAIADFGDADALGFTVIQQTDGKFVVAGMSIDASQGTHVALARFDADGILDTTFGGSGRVTLDLGGTSEAANGLIQQSNGKLVIAGTTNAGGVDRIVFARLNIDGTLDPSFGSNGASVIDFGSGSQSQGYALAQQSDGKLVAAGAYLAPGTSASDFALVRVSADGVLDNSFDGDGRLALDITGFDDTARALVIQPDGAIVGAGVEQDFSGGTSNGVVIRVEGDGSPDNTFGTGGIAVIDLGPASAFNAIVLQSNGQFLATGVLADTLPDEFGPDMILTRLNDDGTLDSTYANDGVSLVDFGEGSTGPSSAGLALIQQSDGRWVATAGSSLSQFGIVRIDDAAASPGWLGLRRTLEAGNENGAPMTYTVRRTGGASGVVTVDYATEDGTATGGSDLKQPPAP